MKNVVVYCNGETTYENISLLGWVRKGTTDKNGVTIVMENCYYVNEWETEAVELVSSATKSNYNLDATSLANFFWDSAENDDGLTSYLLAKDFVTAYNGATGKLPDFMVDSINGDLAEEAGQLEKQAA